MNTIPSNPLNFQFVDENSGDLLDPNSDVFAYKFVKTGKHKKETELTMLREFDHFITFLEHHETAGPDFIEKMMTNELDEKIVAKHLGLYVLNRINLKKWQHSGAKVPIDLSTMDRVFSQVGTVLAEKTGYKVVANRTFDQAREMKVAYMRNAKRHAGLGQLAGQAHPFTRAELDFLLHSDTVSMTTPRNLITCFYLQFVLYFQPRVREEVYNVTRGEV